VPKEEEQESIAAQEIQAFDESVAEQASRPTQPPIEGIPEESDHLRRQLAQQSSHDEPLHSFRVSSLQWPLKSSTSEIPSVPRNAPGSPGRAMDIDHQPEGLELPSTPGTIGGSSSVPNLPAIPGTSTFGEADAPPLLEDQSISLAQKHIHWALSALEFEDVDTAVKELKNSLRYLGAA